jgi:hypothetical protein
MSWQHAGLHGETILSGCNSTQNNQVATYSTFLQPSTAFADSTTGINGIWSVTESLPRVVNFTFDHWCKWQT